MRISPLNHRRLYFYTMWLVCVVCVGCARVSLPDYGREQTDLFDQRTTAFDPPKSHLVVDIPEHPRPDSSSSSSSSSSSFSIPSYSRDWTIDRIPNKVQRDLIQKSTYNTDSQDSAPTTPTAKRPVFMNLYEKPPPVCFDIDRSILILYTHAFIC